MAVDRLNLPTRLTTPAPGQTPRAALPGEPAADLNTITAHIDTVLAPGIEAAETAIDGHTHLAEDIIDLDPSQFVLTTDSRFTQAQYVDVTVSRALGAGDEAKTLKVTSTTAVTLTIPHHTNTVGAVAPWPCPVGTRIEVQQRNSGAVTIVAVTGVGLVTPLVDNLTPPVRVPGRWSTVMLEKDVTNNWILYGAAGATV